MRDLCRARETTVSDLRRARQHLLSFLLRHGRVFEGRSHWSKAHRNWLAAQRFDHRAQQIAMEEYIHSIEQIEERRDRLTRQMVKLLPNWSLNPVVDSNPGPARCCTDLGGDLGIGDRLLQAIQQSASVHGLAGPGSQRAIHRRQRVARVDHKSRKHSRKVHAG